LRLQDSSGVVVSFATAVAKTVSSMLRDLSVPIVINSPWARFFALSLLCHIFIFFGLVTKTALRTPPPAPIPVSILPQATPSPERRREPAKSARAERNRAYPAQAK